MLYLKQLSLSDGKEIYSLLQEISSNDNGFHNPVFGMTYDQYLSWLAHEYAVDHGDLESWMVPQTTYWLYDGMTPVGYGRIRHYLNDSLKATSGHIGYAVAKSKRGNGYGNAILKLLIEKCKELGISKLQVGAKQDNIHSNKVIKRNGGILFRTEYGKNFYSIDLNAIDLV